MFQLLPWLFLVFIFGFTALEGDWSRSITGPRSSISAEAQGQMFMTYRNMVLTYLEVNANKPTSSGTIPIADLTFPLGVVAADLPAQITNYVVVGNGTRTVYVFEPAVPGIIGAFNQEFPGDVSLGIDTGGEFASDPAGVLSALPAAANIGNGDIISVVQIGE
jgi:hypothetical protein